MVVATRPLRRRGRRRADPGRPTSSCRPVVGVDSARAGRPRWCTTTCPDNVAAHMLQEVGDVEAAMAAAPHTLDPRPRHRAQRVDADGGQGRLRPVGRRRAARCGSTPPPRPRPACAPPSPPSSACRSAKVECIAPDVGGGFGVKIVHPWPEEVLVPWAARSLGREVKWAEDRREHFISSRARARPAAGGHGRLRRRGPAARASTCGSGTTTAPTRRTASSCRSSPRPSCSGRTSRAPTGSSSGRSTPTPSSSRRTAAPAGRRAASRWSGRWTRSPTQLGLDRAEVRSRNFIQPDEMPYDHGLIFQDGRPLIYDSGDFPASPGQAQGAGRLGRLRRPTASRPSAEGRRVGIGIGCYVEGTGVGPYEGGARHGRDQRPGQRRHRPDHPGPGPPDRRSPRSSPTSSACRSRTSHVTTGDTRRFGYAVGTFASRAAVMSGNAIALAARKVRAKALRIAGRRPRGRPRRPRDRRRRRSRSRGAPGTSIAAGHGRGAVQPAALRLRRGGQAGHPVRRHVRPRQAAGGRRRGARARGQGLLLADPGRRSPTACTRRSSRPTRTPPRSASCATASCTTAATLINPMIVEGQVHGGVAQGVGGALYERMAYDESGQLLNASFMDFLMPYASEVPHIETDHLETPSPAEPAGHQGRRRGRRHPGVRRHRLRDRGRRGLPDPLDADQPGRAVGAAPAARRADPTDCTVPAQEGSR